jgi:hypothetical protein
MLVSFRNGIVQKPQSPNFLLKGPKGITLSCDEDPLIVTISDGESNYLLSFSQTIKNAWKGPFDKHKDFYLYIEIDKVTGKSLFGVTDIKPKSGANKPLDDRTDQHFFEFKSKKMFVKSRAFRAWKHVLRVFVGEFRKGSILKTYDVGSNFNLVSQNRSGFILFDSSGNPIKNVENGQFITTETNISGELYNVGRIDQQIFIKKAFEPIPEYYCITQLDNNYVGLAKDDKLCYGISLFSRSPDENVNYMKFGYVYNENWNWTVLSGTPIYCGVNGEITLTPQKYSSQRIGIVISSNVIFLDIEDKIQTNF